MLIGEINKIGPSTIIISILVPHLPAVARFMQPSRMATLATFLYRAGTDFVAIHSFFHTLSAANSTTAFDKTFHRVGPPPCRKWQGLSLLASQASGSLPR
jgi:hypothetical protein